MKILIFLIITLNLYSYMLKSERYPREYTYYEKQKFEEISLGDNKKWPPDIKFIPASFTFGGTPKEKLYMKKSIEKINNIFRSVKTPIIRLTIERDIDDHLPAWTGYPISVEVAPDQKDSLDLLVVPNIKRWREFNSATFNPVLGKGDAFATHGFFGGPSKILIGITTVFSNLITNQESDFYHYSYLDYKRVHTFTHELMHALGFGNHVKYVHSVMNTGISRDYIERSYYTHGPMSWDVLFIEMRYNKFFETCEEEDKFLEKLYSNKLRRPDRRSRKEKLLYPIKD